MDHEEFVETGIENRHSLRLVSPMKLGQRTVLQSPRLSENRVLSLNEFRNFGLAIRNLMRGTDFLEPLNLVYRFIFIAWRGGQDAELFYYNGGPRSRY